MIDLSDSAILTCLEQLAIHQKTRFDMALGPVVITIDPRKPLRPQLIKAIEPHFNRLLADRLAGPATNPR